MSIEAMKQAIEAFEIAAEGGGVNFHAYAEELRQAIAEAEKQEPVLKPCWYESKEKTMCRKCGQVHAEAILPNQEKQEPVAQCSYPRCQTSAGCAGVCSKTFLTAQPQRQPHELLCVCGATWCINADGGEELVDTPPAAQRQWVGLTDEEITELHHEIKVRLMGTYKTEDIYRAIEAKLKQKNGFAEEKNT